MAELDLGELGKERDHVVAQKGTADAGIGLVEGNTPAEEDASAVRRGAIVIDHLSRVADDPVARNEAIDDGLVHRGMKYLFAKAVELVVVWGRSKDGKVSITLDPKLLKYPGDILVDPTISKDMQKRILDAAASADHL